MARRLRALPSDVVDAGVAAGLLLLVGAQVAGEPPDGSLAAYLALALAITLPLVWRRRAPLAVVAVVSAALVAQALVAEPAVSFGEFLAMLLATYSVAAHASLARAAAGAVVAFAAVGVHSLQQQDAGAFEWVYGVVYFGGAFLLGRAIRHRAHRAEERVRESAAAERARMARDLHDVISHSVGVMVVQAGAARLALDEDPEATRQALAQVEATGRQTLNELRRLLGVLRAEAPERTPQPGLAQLGSLVEQVRSAGVAIDLVLEGERRALPPGVELAGYRIVQEALTNVMKHAPEANARVRVAFGPAELELEVENDGRTNGAAGSGYGLAGMRERAKLYGGSVEAAPVRGGGFRVLARLPVRRRAE
ncbi:MAG: sensor histidine kinase [Gaiellaceae bacterium]